MLKFSKNTRGFTLIELLVVIAIIGILAGIVLTSLSSARGKANDTSIQGSMSSLRSQAEIYYSSHDSSYAGMFTSDNTWASADTDIQRLLKAVTDQGGLTADAGGVPGGVANNDANAWAASTYLPGAKKYYCVDSMGVAKLFDAPSSSTACPS